MFSIYLSIQIYPKLNNLSLIYLLKLTVILIKHFYEPILKAKAHHWQSQHHLRISNLIANAARAHDSCWPLILPTKHSKNNVSYFHWWSKQNKIAMSAATILVHQRVDRSIIKNRAIREGKQKIRECDRKSNELNRLFIEIKWTFEG